MAALRTEGPVILLYVDKGASPFWIFRFYSCFLFSEEYFMTLSKMQKKKASVVQLMVFVKW